MAISVSGRKLAIATGALTGGYISDDDGFGTLYGAAVGAYVGSEFNPIKPDIKKFIRRTSSLDVEKPQTEKELLQEKLLKAYNNSNKNFSHLNSTGSLDLGNVIGSVNNGNFLEALEKGSEEDLRNLDIIVNNQNGFKPSTAINSYPISNVNSKQVISIKSSADSDITTKSNSLKNHLKSLGYTSKEVQDKMVFFQPLLEGNNDFVLNPNNNTLNIGANKFKLTSRFNGIDSYVDGKNYYAVRKMLPFSQLLSHANILEGDTNALNAERVIQSLGIDDPGVAEHVRKNINTWATAGMLPEDFQALVLMSKNLDISKDELESLVNKNRLIRDEETSLIRRGFSNEEVSGSAGHQTVRLSNIGTLEDVIAFNKDGTLKERGPLITQLSSTAGVDGLSDNQKAKENIRKMTGKQLLESEVKADNYYEINVSKNSKFKAPSFMAPGERNPEIDASRTTRVRGLGSTPLSALHSKLTNEGKISSAYSTSVIHQRLAVDTEDFNKLARNYFKGNSTITDSVLSAGQLALGDGTQIGYSRALGQYYHSINRTADLNLYQNEFKFSKNISDIIDTRNTFNIHDGDLKLPTIITNDAISNRKEVLSDLTALLKNNGLDLSDDVLYDLSNTARYTLNDEYYVKKVLRDIEKKYTVDLSTIMQDTDLMKEVFDITLWNGSSDTFSAASKVITEDLQELLNSTNRSMHPELLSLAKKLEDASKGLYTMTQEDLDFMRMYNKAVDAKIAPGEVIGYDANGVVLAPKDIQADMKLSNVERFVEGSDEFVRLHFNGYSDLGKEGEVVKYFGGNVKANMLAADREAWGATKKLSALLNYSHLLGVDKEELFDKSPQELDALYERLLRTKDMSFEVISDSGTASQNRAFTFVNEFANTSNSMDDIKKAFSAETDDGTRKYILNDNIINKLENRISNIRSEINPNSTRSVAKGRNKLWSMSQFVNAITENKGSSAAVEGMRIGAYKNISSLVDDIHATGLTKEEKNLIMMAEADVPDASKKAWKQANTKHSQIEKRRELAKQQVRDIFKNGYYGLHPSGLMVNKAFEESLFDHNSRAMLEGALERKADEIYKLFNSDNMVKNYTNGRIFDDDVLSMFELAYNQEGVDYFIGSPDTHPTFSTGSGNKVGFSHFSQTQLRNSGMTLEQLELFGKHDVSNLYELEAMRRATHTSGKVSTNNLNKHIDYSKTLNNFFENDLKGDVNKIKQVTKALAAAAPEKIDDVLRQFNVSQEIIDNDYLYYHIQNDTGNSIKTVAISKRDTKRNGNVRVTDGNKTASKIHRANFNIIENDLNLLASTEAGREQNSTLLRNSVNHLEKLNLELLASYNNPLMKDILTREGANSGYMKVLVSNDEAFIKNSKKFAEKGMEVKGITRKHAMDILNNQGFNLKSMDELDDFIKDGILTIDRKSDTYMPLVYGREPAQGPHSFSITFGHVMDENHNSAGAIYARPEDKFDKFFKMQDHDNDHGMTFASENKMAKAEAQELLALAGEHGQEKLQILDFVEQLGVKTAKDGEEYSVDTAARKILESPETYGLSEADIKSNSTAYIEQLNNVINKQKSAGISKRALRKQVSPAVTIFAMNLQQNMLSYLNEGSAMAQVLSPEDLKLQKAMGRSLAYMFTENLLKSTHTETSSAISSQEILLDLRSQFFKDKTGNNTKYLDELDKLIDETLKRGLDSGKLKDYEPHIAKMKEHIREGELRAKVNGNTNVLAVNQVARKALSNLNQAIKENKSITELQGPTLENLMDDVMSVLGGREDLGTPSLVKVVQNEKAEMQSLKLSGAALQNLLGDNIKVNSKPLMIGAALLGVGALMTQKDPAFNSNANAKAEVSNMTLAPQLSTANDSSMFDMLKTPTTGYILPEMDVAQYTNKAMDITGSYVERPVSHTLGMSQAIFGDNLQSVRIDTSENYYM